MLDHLSGPHQMELGGGFTYSRPLHRMHLGMQILKAEQRLRHEHQRWLDHWHLHCDIPGGLSQMTGANPKATAK